MMAAAVKLSPDGESLETGTPVALFPVRIPCGPTPGTNNGKLVVPASHNAVLADFRIADPTPLSR